VFRRLGADSKITESSASFTFLADNEKNMITNIKLAFSGIVTFRCIELENRLIGTRLPLAAKDIALFTETAALQFDEAAKDVPCIPDSALLLSDEKTGKVFCIVNGCAVQKAVLINEVSQSLLDEARSILKQRHGG